ncbi:hypothetical protein [uncultured Fructobacillus sp.]|uniref:hypothetical protein n=1 Tax=uncultured Fructobacillus sp. TaxID=591942 RepID=UPI0025942478|nr:hypothetical protein [uncultured Fructobacillus sp.]
MNKQQQEVLEKLPLTVEKIVGTFGEKCLHALLTLSEDETSDKLQSTSFEFGGEKFRLMMERVE